MLTRHNEAVRFLIGLGVTLAILVAAFTLFNFWIQTRGALPAELAASYYPGDELVADPDLLWMHGISIQAPPEKVWPWLIQIGDPRAGSTATHLSRTWLPEKNCTGMLTR